MTRIEVEALAKSYAGGVRALAGVSLEIGNGLFGLLGPNGAGKSTLMRILATVATPDAGQVRFEGRDALADPDRVRRTLGYLPQDFGAFPGVTARRLLDYVARLKGIVDRGAREAAIEALIEKVNLGSAADRPAVELSGGTLQRVGIAQALLGSPSLVIVDEPTAGLDPMERNRLHHLLADVAETATVILSTHIIEDVAALCVEMAILARGRIARRGRPAEVAASLAGRVWHTRACRRDLQALTQQVVPLLVVAAATELDVTVIADTAPSVDFRLRPPTLEDAYHLALREADERWP